jgi:D-threo-aldose 1-dehydrogenase
MDPLAKRRIGKTNLYVTCLGLGCAGLARSDNDEQANKTFHAAFNQGINYFDTAPLYGRGLSEIRLGHALKKQKRETFIISTKVGRIVKSDNKESPIEVGYDYSGKGILESYNESLRRLKVEKVDILFIHDPDNYYETAINEAYPTLDKLRSNGFVQAIGAGMNQWKMELRFAEEGDFDCFLLAGRYTLLEQTALKEFLPYCLEHKISVIIGGPYNSGILASNRESEGRYNYREAPRDIIEKANRLKELCMEFNVPLKAASLQFVLAHPAVASVIPGTKSPEHQVENFDLMKFPIPYEFWDALKDRDIIDEEAPTPR